MWWTDEFGQKSLYSWYKATYIYISFKQWGWLSLMQYSGYCVNVLKMSHHTVISSPILKYIAKPVVASLLSYLIVCVSTPSRNWLSLPLWLFHCPVWFLCDASPFFMSTFWSNFSQTLSPAISRWATARLWTGRRYETIAKDEGLGERWCRQ